MKNKRKMKAGGNVSNTGKYTKTVGKLMNETRYLGPTGTTPTLKPRPATRIPVPKSTTPSLPPQKTYLPSTPTQSKGETYKTKTKTKAPGFKSISKTKTRMKKGGRVKSKY